MKLNAVDAIIALLMFATAALSIAQDGWYKQDSGTSAVLLGVFAADPLTCWVTGSVATVLKTEDGGDNWFEQSVPTAGTLYDVFFIDADNGWIVGEGGNVFHTTDGGTNWALQYSCGIDLKSVHFIDPYSGWATGGETNYPSGNDRIIIHTSNGGASWSTQHYENDSPLLTSVHFVDGLHGHVVGDASTILATDDGGDTWVEQDPGVSGNLSDVFFTSPDTGYVVGWNGMILGTTDGGTNWDLVTSGTTGSLGSIWFTDAQNGWIVGGSGGSGPATILHSMDGGLGWSPQTAPTDTAMAAVHFPDQLNGWAVGIYGVIIHTTTGGATGIGGGSSPAGGMSLYNSPDPFTDASTLHFVLDSATPVRIDLYDLSGRIVATLADSRMEPGEHSMVFDAGDLCSGVYMCLLRAGERTVSDRMVILR